MAPLRFWLPLVLAWILVFVPPTMTGQVRAVEATDAEGNTYLVADNRKPALYTQNFGDCLGGSSINVTRFDAAYYQDNMTVLFHLEGNTNVANETLMSMTCSCKPPSARLIQDSVHRCLCLWSISIRSCLQPLLCSNLQVRTTCGSPFPVRVNEWPLVYAQ